MTKVTTRQEYIEAELNSGIEVGDLVIVTRIARGHENGWGNIWTDPMNKFVGELCEVTNVYSRECGIATGVRLRPAKEFREKLGMESEFYKIYSFPFYVLYKVQTDMVEGVPLCKL